MNLFKSLLLIFFCLHILPVVASESYDCKVVDGAIITSAKTHIHNLSPDKPLGHPSTCIAVLDYLIKNENSKILSANTSIEIPDAKKTKWLPNFIQRYIKSGAIVYSSKFKVVFKDKDKQDNQTSTKHCLIIHHSDESFKLYKNPPNN